MTLKSVCLTARLAGFFRDTFALFCAKLVPHLQPRLQKQRDREVRNVAPTLFVLFSKSRSPQLLQILRQQYKIGFDLEKALQNESAAHHTFNEMLHDANNKSATLHDIIQEQFNSMDFKVKMGIFGSAGIGIVAIGVVTLYLCCKLRNKCSNVKQIQYELRSRQDKI